MGILDYNTTIKYHSIVEQLMEQKNNTFRRIHNNIAQKNNAIIDIKTHDSISQMVALISEISKLADINRETTKWIHSQVNEISRLDFSLEEPKIRAMRKEAQLTQTFSFLKSKF